MDQIGVNTLDVCLNIPKLCLYTIGNQWLKFEDNLIGIYTIYIHKIDV